MRYPLPEKITEKKPSSPSILIVPGMKAFLLIASFGFSTYGINHTPPVISNTRGFFDDGSVIGLRSATSLQPIEITITNNSTNNARACLFGLWEHNGQNNYGNPPSITIQGINETYDELLLKTMQIPRMIGLIRLNSSNSNQMYETIEWRQTNALGFTASLLISPMINPWNQQLTVSEQRLNHPLDSGTAITINIHAESSLRVTLYPTT